MRCSDGGETRREIWRECERIRIHVRDEGFEPFVGPVKCEEEGNGRTCLKHSLRVSLYQATRIKPQPRP